ncbi:MAG: TetR/AcrR family transcriptional regulator [Bacteroidota bacterium]
MKRSTRNAARTKQEIIAKSAAVFNVHGYAGTKMQMLVEATGFQMGGIYRHFDTKLDLAKAAFQHNYEVLIKSNFAVKEGLNPQERLTAFLRNYKKSALNPSIPGGCPLLNTAIEMDDTDESFRQLTQASVKEVIDTIAQTLVEGQGQGFFMADFNPREEAQYLFAAIEGAIMLSRITKDVKAFVHIFDRAVADFGGKVGKR